MYRYDSGTKDVQNRQTDKTMNKKAKFGFDSGQQSQNKKSKKNHGYATAQKIIYLLQVEVITRL